MCKAIKDGGARCAYHVGENASAALVTYVASTTGLGGQDTRDAFTDLVAEYADAPEPSRAEVDQFIEQQIFRARHEPTLTEKRRDSIIRRLREALGKATPSGATFGAWKNLVAEAWSRVRRRAAAAFVAGALAFSLGACGNTGSDVRPEPVATQAAASAPANPAATSGTDAEATLSSGKWTVKNVNVEPRVVGLKGEKAPEQVKDLLVKVAQEHTFNGQSLKYDGKEGKAESAKWMLSARKDMTADAASDWTNTVNTYFREKKAQGTPAWNSMMSWTTYGLLNDSTRPTDTSKPIMFDMTVENMDIDLSSDGRIWVTMETSAKFNYLQDGKPAVSKADRQQEFWLKDVDGQWKIDGWTGTINITPVK